MTDIRVLLAYNIKKRRKALGISQEKLAEKVSTSTHYIGQIEQKNKFPSPEMMERIAAALEIDTALNYLQPRHSKMRLLQAFRKKSDPIWKI